jgi:hypothetical protein
MPYLVVILAVLAGYFLYTRVLAPAPPAVAPEALPAPVVTPVPAAEPTPTPRPAVGVQQGVALPARAVGRGNPFSPLVVPEEPRPPVAVAPPEPPVVPAPVFPGLPVEPGVTPTPAPPAARVAGILIHDGAQMAIVDIAGKTYIVKVGDIVEGFRVIRITGTTVVLRQGDVERELELGGGGQR